MQIVSTPVEMQKWGKAARSASRSVGFVPTMGALHAGHAHLLERSAGENDATVLSIFVNPLQFNDTGDFARYPRTLDRDLAEAESHGVDCVFLPSETDMYPPDASVRIAPGSASHGMEGDGRPGHFEGVATIVGKLFNCVLPDRAYFGKKDYQQLAVIRQMVADLDFPVEIVGIDTVRESDGLAMSSRNMRLEANDRVDATVLHRALLAAGSAHRGGTHDAAEIETIVRRTVETSSRARLEYASVVHQTTLRAVDSTEHGAVVCLAAWFGDVRLIDNLELPAV